MTDYDAVVVHYGELWLKGRNRDTFITRLKSNIQHALKGLDAKIIDNRDRLLIEFKRQKGMDDALKRLGYVFGISWFAPVMVSKNTIQSIIKTSNSMLGKSDTVKIVASRSYKKVPFDSYGLVSQFIKQPKKLNFKIDRDAKKELRISVTAKGAIISSNKIDGLGGLPMGSSGKAILLLSGGIDSPVAAFYAMKRGLELSYLHMHAFPKNDEAIKSKIKELLEVLSRYGPVQTYYAPAYIFQSATLKIPQKYELVIFKRFLYKLADEIAAKDGASAIVTGESLGQVASQTIPNMAASQSGIDKIIIRPLVGFDKNEIIEKARSLETYDISIKPYKDVCSIGVKNPSTNMNERLVSKLYSSCRLDLALNRTVKLMKLGN